MTEHEIQRACTNCGSPAHMTYYKKPYCVSCYVYMFPVKKLYSEADRLFSLLIRARDGNRCQNPNCKRSSQKMECSHYWNRTHYSTRYDPDNCITLCHGCHQKWEHEKQGDYRDLMIKRLGLDRYDLLKAKHYQTMKKRDAIEGFLMFYYGEAT